MRTFLVCSVMIVLGGCGGSDRREAQAPPSACPPGSAPSPAGYCAPVPAPATSAPTPAPTNPPAPSASPLPPLAAPGPAATPVDASLAVPLFEPLARQYLPQGAKPAGAALAGQFKAGQSLEQTLQAQPGKCYTVVGAAAPTVQNLDIQLLPALQLGGGAPVIAQDQTTGAMAVLGAAPNCFRWAAPFSSPLRVVVTVTAGEGLAGAQVYEQ